MNVFDIPLLCLTLPNERSRQVSVKQEFLKTGFRHFEFFPGYDANHKLVKQAFSENRVKSFPKCFRCGQSDCGNENCNNILIPSQVAVALGYQSLMRRIVEGPDEFVFICEDDIVFAKFARQVLSDKTVVSLLTRSSKENSVPFLLRLCAPNRPDYFDKPSVPHPIRITRETVMSNPGFIINRSFAALAIPRLDNIDHTADVIIHNQLSRNAKAYTLRPQVISDRSWSTGECESLIHPKQNHINALIEQYGSNSEVVISAKRRLIRHLKKATVIDYAFIGSPRCGSHYVSNFLKQNGLQIEHEALGRDGLCAWQYTVDCNDHPYIQDIRCRDSYFVYPRNYIIYVRDPRNAVASLIIENEQAPLSYSHRRNMILEHMGIDLEEFASREERAARAYIHWYELALRRPLLGIVRVEHLYEDLKRVKGFEAISDVPVAKQESGIGKPYLGVVHERIKLGPEWHIKLSGDTLLRMEMISKQFGYSDVTDSLCG